MSKILKGGGAGGRIKQSNVRKMRRGGRGREGRLPRGMPGGTSPGGGAHINDINIQDYMPCGACHIGAFDDIGIGPSGEQYGIMYTPNYPDGLSFPLEYEFKCLSWPGQDSCVNDLGSQWVGGWCPCEDVLHCPPVCPEGVAYGGSSNCGGEAHCI